MRKTVALIAAVPAVLVGSLVGVSAWSGRAVTERLTQQTSDLTKAFPALTVVEQKVSHGLFSSTRDLTLQLGCLPAMPALLPTGKQAAPEPIRLLWRDVVQHGPFPGGGGVALAIIDSQLISPPAWQARIERVAGKQPLLRLHTTVSFKGAYSSELTVPSLRYQDPQVGAFSMTSIRALLHGQAGADAHAASSYTLEMPGLELTSRASDGTSMTVKLGAVHSETDLPARTAASSPVGAPAKAPAALWLTPSKSKSRAASLTLLGTGPADSPIKPVQAVFEELSFSLESKLDKGLFSSTSRATAKGRINQVALDKVELQSSLKNIDAESYQKLMHTLLGTMLSCDAEVQQTALFTLLPALQKELAVLLQHDPQYALDTLAFELGGKRAELSYSLGTQGVTASDAALPLPAVLLSKGVLRASIKVHTDLIAQVLRQAGMLDPGAAAAAGLPSGVGVNGSDPTIDFMNGMLDQFVELGYLERDGALVKASASFQGGTVLVNGKPMALPGLP